jgi:hypothetical protein
MPAPDSAEGVLRRPDTKRYISGVGLRGLDERDNSKDGDIG